MVWATTRVKPARQRFSPNALAGMVKRILNWGALTKHISSEYHFPEASNAIMI